MNGSSRAGVEGAVSRRRYDSRLREQKAAQTRDRIVVAGTELARECASWDWAALTFRAVAERAGVGERTVYRHFPTERHLHESVMQRLESDAGLRYEDVTLHNLADVTSKVFAALGSFEAGVGVDLPDDPTFVTVDRRRRDALLRAVSATAPQWPDTRHRAVASLLDILWHVPSYERVIGVWGLGGPDAIAAIGWLIGKVVQSVEDDDPPPV